MGIETNGSGKAECGSWKKGRGFAQIFSDIQSKRYGIITNLKNSSLKSQD
jgi:hypothetical protein